MRLFQNAFKMNAYLLMALMALSMQIFAVSCKKDSDLLEQALAKDEIRGLENQKATLIPANFDWGTIPAALGNSVWEIREDFDLEGQTISLPENVTLSFKGGVLVNGTIMGNETKIVSNAPYKILDTIELAGTFATEYLKPYWFGAVMDGITDDRTAFVETLVQAHNIDAKVLIEKDIRLDLETIGTKTIFLDDDTWIEGINDANIIVNNLMSPSFLASDTDGITFKNIDVVWDQKYDATFGWNSDTNLANIVQMKSLMATKRNIVFDNSNPIWKGPVNFRYIFLLDASRNITFDNVKIKAKGLTADTFPIGVIKLMEQYTGNQTVNNSVGITDICRNVNLKDVTFDGVLMGIQGIVDGFKSEGLRSYRYSDAQTAAGASIGGYNGSDGYWMPPPHLIYLNSDGSIYGYNCKNIEIINTIDYGQYIGAVGVRPTISGYCNSLKLVDDQENVIVDNYRSYRRDGLADIGNIINGTIKNVYSESTGNLFPEKFIFNSLRFLGTLSNVVFDNIIIKDNSEVANIYPMDNTHGNFVTMNNVHIHVNELNTSAQGPFGIFGSNNKIDNSSLTIKKHTSAQTYRGVVFNDNTTMDKGSNNHYNVLVNGWRSIDSEPIGRSIRMLLANPSNSNNNYAKVIDVSNNFVIEQINDINKSTWTRSEVVILGDGNSHELAMNIPNGFAVNQISATTIENLHPGIKVSIGTSGTQKDDLLATVSNTSGKISNSINELNAVNTNRSIYLFSNGDFQNTGKIEVTLELIRIN